MKFSFKPGRAEMTFICACFVLLVSWGCSGDKTGGGGGGGPTQLDRSGFPVVNTALIPTAQKDDFNVFGDPSTDTANFRTTAGASIMSLRSAVAGINGFPAADNNLTVDNVLDVTIPSVLAVNFANTVAFPNGRQPADDVMDAILGVVLDRGNALGGGAGIPDNINANDVTFLSTFPFLARAQ